MTPPLVALAIQELPNLIALLKAVFARRNPDVPPPSDEDVIAAYQAALASSLAKDAAWRAQHPD